VLEQQVAENAGEAAGTHEAPQGFDQPLDGFDTLFPVAPPPRGEQGVLFTDPVSVVEENLGYRGAVACKAAGITYRQLDYWARTDLVVPTVRSASGSGTQRLYSFRDVLVLKIVKRLLDTGVSLQQIRTSIEHLRTRGIDDLANITLMSDGTTVYECTSPSEVIDLVQAGQGVFGIAIGRVWREIEMNLNGQPGEEMHENFEGDELAARRARRAQA
jgi:Predicted transcriptional regulators